jgi:hypothetical protein
MTIHRLAWLGAGSWERGARLRPADVGVTLR